MRGSEVNINLSEMKEWTSALKSSDTMKIIALENGDIAMGAELRKSMSEKMADAWKIKLYATDDMKILAVVIKGTASAVNKKIRAAKEIKDSEKLRIMYDELINEVLQEREEAVRIALVYKAELDRIEISDKDIEHLHNTVSRVLEIIKAIQLAGTLGKPESEREKIEIQVQGYEQIKELISVDTLKSMQLLGFNYKAAIGEPLTQLCANAITGWGNKNNYHKKR